MSFPPFEDPLDAFMAGIASDDVPAQAGNVIDGTVGDTMLHALPPAVEISGTAQALVVRTRNRRYQAVSRLVEEGFFSDEEMERRAPTVYREHVGRALDEQCKVESEARFQNYLDQMPRSGDARRPLRQALGTTAALTATAGAEAQSSLGDVTTETGGSFWRHSAEVRAEYAAGTAIPFEERSGRMGPGYLSSMLTSAIQRQERHSGNDEDMTTPACKVDAMHGLGEHVARLRVDATDETEMAGEATEDATSPEDDGPGSLAVERDTLVSLMIERFLRGEDGEYVDYSAIDNDDSLDILTEAESDATDAYFSTSTSSDT